MEAALSQIPPATTLEQSELFRDRLERTLKGLSPKIGPATLALFLSDRGLRYMRDAGLLNTVNRLAMFLGECAHESTGFTARVENLNYSAAGIVRTWPNKFANEAAAERFARRPAALANAVYGGRYGNVNPDDGWRFRGRTYLGVTFFDNYVAIEKATGLPFSTQPALAEEPDGALAGACGYWTVRKLNQWADKNDFTGLTRQINAKLLGLNDRRANFELARRMLRG